MHFIGIIILVTIIVEVVLNGLADYLNLKKLNKKLPEEFQGVYDPQRYQQSQEYLKVNTRFGWVTSGIHTILILIFYFN